MIWWPSCASCNGRREPRATAARVLHANRQTRSSNAIASTPSRVIHCADTTIDRVASVDAPHSTFAGSRGERLHVCPAHTLRRTVLMSPKQERDGRILERCGALLHRPDRAHAGADDIPVVPAARNGPAAGVP